MSNSRRRVKLFVLDEERQWSDRGTGHVSAIYTDQDNESKGIMLLVRSEEDGKVLLQSHIQTDTVYQKQQDTLVVWSEADNDIALSFQVKEGCDEIWEKICQVQGKDPSVDVTQSFGEDDEEHYEEGHEYGKSYDDGQDYNSSIDLPACEFIELPACELNKLDEISTLCHNVLALPAGREKLALAVEQESYIQKLIDLFHMCEDLDNIDGLHSLYDIFKSLFLLEKNSLFEIMFTPDHLMDIIGILEYDPSKKEPTQHRNFIKENVKFKEVLPIENKELLQKIHQTYKVQYIKDVLVPVPSLFEENMSTLSSFLFFNKIEIVNLIQEDEWVLNELFNKLTDDEISDEKRKETVLFLKELCTLSQTLQQANRETFLKALSDHGLLNSLETLMNFEDDEMKQAIIDIICCVVEFNPTMVRGYLSLEANTIDEDSILMNMLIDQLICKADSGMGVLLAFLIRTLLDPENMGLGANKMEKSEFLSFFYRHCMHKLTAPLFAATATEDSCGKDDFKSATVLDYLIDILSFCVEHHSYHIKNYILSKDLLRRILVLMKSRHKFLSLAALRFTRKIIGMKDELYNRYIIKGKLLEPIVKAFSENGQRYNLLNSAVIEMFEFIRLEDIKTLCAYIVDNHIEAFKSIEYVETFKGLQMRYEQEKDRIKKSNMERNANHGIIHVNSARKRRDERSLDEDEESWFDSEEEEISDATSNSSPNATPPQISMQEDSPITKPITAKLKDVDLLDNIPIQRSPSPPPSSRTPSPPPMSRTPSPPLTGNKLSPNNSPKNSPKKGDLILSGKPVATLVNKPGGKPVLNIKINSNASSMLNSVNGPNVNHKDSVKENDVDHSSNDADSSQNNNLDKVNGSDVIKTVGLTPPKSVVSNSVDGKVTLNHTSPVVNDVVKSPLLPKKSPVIENAKSSPVVQIKARTVGLSSLVAYSDDEEDEDETDNGVDDIVASPAKKQRMSLT